MDMQKVAATSWITTAFDGGRGECTAMASPQSTQNGGIRALPLSIFTAFI